MVAEILDVLLDNAHGHGARPVTVAARRSGHWLAVDVADHGPGFAGAGDEFLRRGPSSNGHGIGLALAQALAHAEGGRLAITAPRPPTGTLWLDAASTGSQVRSPRLQGCLDRGDQLRQ